MLLQTLLNGLLIGVVWGVLGLGKQIVIGVIHFVNFAHGHLVLLAMYVSYLLWVSTNADPFLLLPVTVTAMILLGVLLDFVFVRPLVRRGGRSQMIASLALALAIENGALMILGPDPRSIRVWWSNTATEIGGIYLNNGQLMSLAIGLAAFVATWWLLNKTSIGTQIRATSQDREAAQYMGINIQKVYGIAFVLSVALAGVVGGMFAVSSSISPGAGWTFVILMFVVPILGGLGSIAGTMVAGVIVGIVQGLSASYLDIQLQNAMVYVLFVLFLIVRPQGLFGRSTGEVTVRVT